MKKTFLIFAVLFASMMCHAQSSLNIVVTQQPCNNDGIVTCTVVGLTPPLDFSYQIGNNTIVHAGVSSLTDVLYNYSGAPMYVYATTASGQNSYNYVSAQPFNVSQSNITTTPGFCPTLGTASVSGITGGTPPYNYEWLNINNNVLSTSNPASLPQGIIKLKINDNAGCSYVFDDSVWVLQNSPISVATSVVAANCTNGSASITSVTGGVAPYTYSWSNAATSNSINNLMGGYYNCSVTDAQGCAKHTTLYVPQSVQIPVQTTPTNATCAQTDGAAIAFGSGGIPPYTYQWSNSQNSQSITNLTTGYYQVVATDANGCTGKGLTYVGATTPINVTYTSTPTFCTTSTGAATLNISGGTQPYNIQWNTFPAQTGSTATNLSAGSYGFIVTDNVGCTRNGTVIITATNPINTTVSSTPAACSNTTGTATVNISGGTAPYTVAWNTSPAQSGTTASNLGSGNYSFTVTDNVGCIRNGTVHVGNSNPISASITSSPASCISATGTASVTVSGGTPPYTYAWNNTATTSSISNLPSGSYSVIVSDNASCSIIKNVTVNTTSPVYLAFSTTPASCIYNADGGIQLVATGGAIPYTYYLDGLTTASSMSNLSTGNYSAYVVDNNGCTTPYSNIQVGYDASNTSCYCTLTGTVYHDANNNCTQDANEDGIPNIQIQCSGLGSVYTNSNGVYTFNQVPSGTYTLTESIQVIYPLSSCQNNSISVTVSAASNCVITNNFANTINPIHDVHISNWNLNQPVPGNNFNQKIVVSNLGTIVENPLAIHKDDGQLNAPFIAGSIPFASSGANQYSTAASSSFTLTPGQNSFDILTYTVPTNIPMSTQVECKDSIAHIAPMSSWLTDNSPWDNIVYKNSTVVSSYDPNFKEVLPKGIGPNGNIYEKDSMLEYMVHFQNLGTYYAQNIVVLDTLDADLDWSTLRPIYQSHPCQVTISNSGVAKFEFKNIHLSPEIYNDGLSNGMFTYMIRRKKNLAIGTQIKNSAAIYFDYNAPIITNTTLNTIAAPQHVDEIAKAQNELIVYPNPTNDLIHTQIANATIGENYSIILSDITGKIIQTQNGKVKSTHEVIDLIVNQYSDGMYFIQLKTSKGIQSTKFIKK